MLLAFTHLHNSSVPKLFVSTNQNPIATYVQKKLVCNDFVTIIDRACTTVRHENTEPSDPPIVGQCMGTWSPSSLLLCTYIHCQRSVCPVVKKLCACWLTTVSCFSSSCPQTQLYHSALPVYTCIYTHTHTLLVNHWFLRTYTSLQGGE